MRINHNIAALNTYRQLSTNSANGQKSLEKLSSGLRINKAGDDAAGLAISEKMRGQIRGLDQAARNSQDGISLISTAEGALSETHSILQRMRELAVQASNDTNTEADRAEIQKEVNQLTSEINRIGNTTEFNTKKLLNGDVSNQKGIKAAGPLTANATTLSNLDLAKNSSLEAGSYSVKIEDTHVASVNHTVDAVVTGISINANSDIGAGTHTITIAEEDAKAIEFSAGHAPLTNVKIDPNSLLGDGAHTVKITREDTAGNLATANTGLAANSVSVTGTDGVSGTYTVKTVASGGAVAAGTAAAGTYITGLNVDDPTININSGVGYRLAYVEEDSTNGTYSVQLQDSLGNALSDKVLLDNNTQHYDLYSGGSKIGISIDTSSGVNTALAAANAGAGEDGNYNTVAINTDVSVYKGADQVGTTQTISASSGAANITIGDFKIAFASGAGLHSGKSDNFTVTNTLTAKIDAGAAQTFTAGDSVAFANGVIFDTDADLTKYVVSAAGTDYNLTASTVKTYTATHDGSDAQTVSIADGGTYNLGNGVSFTVGTLSGAATHDFTVVDTAAKKATLTNTDTSTVKSTLSGINSDSTLDFGSGLKMDIAALNNGTATFDISGTTEDKSLTMQVGANQGQLFSVNVHDMRSAALGISSESGNDVIKDSDGNVISGAAYISGPDVTNGTDNVGAEHALDLSDTTKATAAIKAIDTAIQTVSAERSKLGAYQNRLEHTINNLGTSSENLTAAESRVRDVDMAKEMMEFTKNNILSQAAQAMLAQANQQPQGVLQLLR